MLGSPPPFLAAMMMARLSLLQSLPRLASTAPFLCLIVAQCECPDMADSSGVVVVSGGVVSGRDVHNSPLNKSPLTQLWLGIQRLQLAAHFMVSLLHFTPIFLFKKVH